MPNFGVEGKLGGGKTIYAVQEAFKRMENGQRVAANVDLFPEKIFPPWWNETRVRLTRIPDHPIRDDLDALGWGNTNPDERKNGLLILDECGIILNSRTFQDSERNNLINWFLNARKLGWDVMFIVQNISMLDKQIRDSLIEYRITVRRMDRYRVPVLSWLGIKVNMPRIHFAIVRYGTATNSMVSERVFFRGSSFFNVYNTRQLIIGSDSSTYSLLSPYHLKGRFMKAWQIARVAARSTWLGGLILGAALAVGYAKYAAMTTKVTSSMPLEQASIVRLSDGSSILFTSDGKSLKGMALRTDKNGTIVTTVNGQQYKVKE